MARTKLASAADLPQDTGWITIPPERLTSPWALHTNAGVLRIRRVGSTVTLRARILGAVGAFLALPTGWRPNSGYTTFGVAGTTGTVGNTSAPNLLSCTASEIAAEVSWETDNAFPTTF